MAIPQKVGWNANEEKLLALVVLSDRHAKKLSIHAGEAFARAFIVENRATSAILMRFRFRYVKGQGDSWYQVTPKSRDKREAFRELRDGITSVFLQAGTTMGVLIRPSDIQSFEPPDDGGDFEKTIAWLVEHDLVHPPTFERIHQNGGDRRPS